MAVWYPNNKLSTFQKVFIETEHDHVYQLAPIPIYKKIYNDSVSEDAYLLGLKILNKEQKQMGQELPEQYDSERQSTYQVNYNRKNEWIEDHNKPPIGSRFYIPPNNFLENPHSPVVEIRERIITSFYHLLDSLEIKHTKTAKITESWVQYYEPDQGRGHNAHNHCRWYDSETKKIQFSGGYYLSDGEPLKDHPYSGVFAFHIREMKYYIRPQQGLLLIWPSDIIHSVSPFYGKTHRAVINFNIEI